MFSRTAIIVFFTFVAFFVASATALVVPRSASNSGEGMQLFRCSENGLSDSYLPGTYFTTGLGACGKTNKESDRIVAVSAAFFDEFPCVFSTLAFIEIQTHDHINSGATNNPNKLVYSTNPSQEHN